MRLPGWAFFALPHSLDATLWLDLACTQVQIPLDIPLLLQLWTEQADIW